MRFKEIKEAISTPVDALTQIAALTDLMSGNLPATSTTASLAGQAIKSLASPEKKDKESIPLAGIKGGKGSVSPSDVSNYLKTKMDDNHRLGILANIQAESGFKPGVLGDNNTSGGLFQHHAGRFSNMINAVGNDWATDWQGQIDFALSEKAGREYLAKSFSSPEEATAWWTKYFEIPANAAQKAVERIRLLKYFT